MLHSEFKIIKIAISDEAITANDIKKLLPHLTKPQIVERIEIMLDLGLPIVKRLVPGSKNTYRYILIP